MNSDQMVQAVKLALVKEGLVEVEVSARHVHLCHQDVTKLFGVGYQLHAKRPLSQPGQYLCEERVRIMGPEGVFENVAILGPERNKTQVEISRTDGFSLGVLAPVRESGDLEKTPGITLVGTFGETTIESGVMVAKRHIHMTVEQAKTLGLSDGQLVMVDVFSQRPIVFKDVVVRVSNTYAYKMHIDLDEANAGDLAGFTLGKIIK